MKSEENVIKIPRLRPYTPVYNSIIRDERLRLPVRAVLILILSCSDEWEISVRGMAKLAGVNKDTMNKMLHELEDAGYISRREQTRDAGRFGKTDFVVTLPSPYLDEDESPCPKNPVTVKPDTVFSVTENSDKRINKDKNNTPKAPKGAARSRQAKSAPEWKPERFAKLWAYYPRGENKQGAIRAWDRLKPSDELIDEMARSLKTQMQSEAWRDGIGIPHLSTWLNNARWEDRLPKIAAETGGGWAADPEVIRHVG